MPNTVNSYIETDLGNVSPNPRGEYNANYDYEYLDLIYYKGGSYLCLAPLGETIKNVPPIAGQTTTNWQCVAIPGDLTPEYISMYNEVVKDYNETNTNTADVAQMKDATYASMTAAQESESKASTSETNARNSEVNAKQSMDKAKEYSDEAIRVNNDTQSLVTGFDEHVATAISNAEASISESTDNAKGEIAAQKSSSLNEFRTDAETVMTNEKNVAVTEIHQMVDSFSADADSKKQEVIQVADEKINDMTALKNDAVNAKNTAETAATTAVEKASEAATSAGEAKSSSDSAKANADLVSANKIEIDNAKSDVDSKVAQFESDLETYSVRTLRSDMTELQKETSDGFSELKGDLNKVIEPVKNLISLTTVSTSSDLTATIDGDDTISISGETTGTSKTVYFYVNQITLPAGTYYLHKDFVSMGGISLRNTSNIQIANVSNTALSEEFTLVEEQTIKYIQYSSPTTKNISISGCHIWLVKDNDRTYEQVSAGFTWTFGDNYISKRAKTSVFAWVDDDGIMVSGTTYGIKSAKAVADTLGIKCTFAACSKYFEQFPGTVDFLLNAQDEGYQITNHSSDHTKDYWYPSEGEPDVTNCRKELLTCRKALVDNGFINIDDFVFPGGTSEDESLLAMVSDYCRSGCMAGKTDGTTHIYGNGRYKIKRCFIRPTEYQGYTLDEYKTFIDNAIANGDMMIFGTHSGIQAQWDADLVTSVLQYVIDSGYDIVTLNRAINQRLPVFNMSEILENEI